LKSVIRDFGFGFLIGGDERLGQRRHGGGAELGHPRQHVRPVLGGLSWQLSPM
jgi:hypothetical protein